MYLKPVLTPSDINNYFCHTLGFYKVTKRFIYLLLFYYDIKFVPKYVKQSSGILFSCNSTEGKVISCFHKTLIKYK